MKMIFLDFSIHSSSSSLVDVLMFAFEIIYSEAIEARRERERVSEQKSTHLATPKKVVVAYKKFQPINVHILE
jgi:hypothetical protein